LVMWFRSANSHTGQQLSAASKAGQMAASDYVSEPPNTACNRRGVRRWKADVDAALARPHRHDMIFMRLVAVVALATMADAAAPKTLAEGWPRSDAGLPSQVYTAAQLAAYNAAYVDRRSGAYMIMKAGKYKFGYVLTAMHTDSDMASLDGDILNCSIKAIRCREIGFVKLIHSGAGLLGRAVEIGDFRYNVQEFAANLRVTAVCINRACPLSVAVGSSIVKSFSYKLRAGHLLEGFSVQLFPNSKGAGDNFHFLRVSKSPWDLLAS